MRYPSTVAIIVVCIFFSGCFASKRAADKAITRRVTKHIANVKEAAAFAVAATYHPRSRKFNVSNVKDEQMRKKLGSLGDIVQVAYQDGGNYEFADSNVVFMSYTLLGVREIVYDFAAIPRVRADDTKKGYYYFVKLADRVYYRRRQIPMM